MTNNFKLTPKENYLRLAKGECPEWVPFSSRAQHPRNTMAPNSMLIFPSWLNKDRTKEGGFDIWGIEYEANYETNFGALPKPGKFMFDDVTKWHEYVKAPDYSDVDFELMAKRDLEAMPFFDPNQSALAIATHNGYFQNVMAFMGFTEGLLAMFEEPEAVLELVMYMNDFYVPFAKKCMEAYNADIIDLGDDMATATDPFVSVEMYREMIKPAHAKHAAVGLDMGRYASMHNCGRCEDYLGDYVEMGITMWNPAQVSNDLKAVKAKFGNKLAISGGWEYQLPFTKEKLMQDEEMIRQSVRDVINTLAPGGGYCFTGGVMALPGNELAPIVNQWVAEESIDLCLDFYK
ncbi:MAG: veratrol--corrinoid protein metyltransferase [Eubacteriaceae bacterium]|nr:veratrol--corrinoid protein metyltransferase [Eubacteriaceae bacterium]